MFKSKGFILFIIPIIFVALIVIYNVFFIKTVEKHFGEFAAGTVSTVLILAMTVIIIFESLSTAFSGMSNPFLGSGKKAKRILQTGRPATAKVTFIGENSKGGVVTINDQPYLNIKLKIDDYKNVPYEVSLDTVIPRHMVPQFQPGALFPVKIDPEDIYCVVIDTEILNDDSIYLSYDEEITNEEKIKIKESGIPANVKLIELSDTGKSENFKSVVQAVWEITPSKGEKYALSFSKALDNTVTDELKKLIDHSFDAIIHPDNKEKIKIDISSLR